MSTLSEEPTHCARCNHTIKNHTITLTRDKKSVNGKCKFCNCKGKLHVE